MRRIVTGHHPDGRSKGLIDDEAPDVKRRVAGNASTLLWVTDESAASLSGSEDRAAREIGVPPPRGGTIFRIAEFPPRSGGDVKDNEQVLRDFGIGPDVKRGHPPRHPRCGRSARHEPRVDQPRRRGLPPGHGVHRCARTAAASGLAWRGTCETRSSAR